MQFYFLLYRIKEMFVTVHAGAYSTYHGEILSKKGAWNVTIKPVFYSWICNIQE